MYILCSKITIKTKRTLLLPLFIFLSFNSLFLLLFLMIYPMRTDSFPAWHPLFHHSFVLCFLLTMVLLPVMYIKFRQPPYWVLLLIFCSFVTIYATYWVSAFNMHMCICVCFYADGCELMTGFENRCSFASSFGNESDHHILLNLPQLPFHPVHTVLTQVLRHCDPMLTKAVLIVRMGSRLTSHPLMKWL